MIKSTLKGVLFDSVKGKFESCCPYRKKSPEADWPRGIIVLTMSFRNQSGQHGSLMFRQT